MGESQRSLFWEQQGIRRTDIWRTHCVFVSCGWSINNEDELDAFLPPFPDRRFVFWWGVGMRSTPWKFSNYNLPYSLLDIDREE